MAKTKSKKAKTPKAQGKTLCEILTTPDIKNMEFWRGVSRAILGDEDNEWLVGEVATAFCLQAGLMQKHWPSINEIARKSQGLDLSWKVSSNRESTPPTCKVTGSYKETHSMKGESDVPDVNVMELPGMSAEEIQEAQQEQPEMQMETHIVKDGVEQPE